METSDVLILNRNGVPAEGTTIEALAEFLNSSGLIISASGSSCGYDIVISGGADPSGITPCDAAWVSAVNNIITAGGGQIYFPPGTYLFSGAITATLPNAMFNFSVRGAAPEVTKLLWNGTTGGIVINYGNMKNSVSFRDISFLTGQQGVCEALTLIQTNPLYSAAEAAPTVIDQVYIRGSDGFAAIKYWNTGIVVQGVSNINYGVLQIWGSSAIQGIGISLDSIGVDPQVFSVVHTFSILYMYALQTGIRYGNTIGRVQGVTIGQFNTTACGIGIFSQTGLSGLAQLTLCGGQLNYTIAGIYTATEIDLFAVGQCAFLPQVAGAIGIALVRNSSTTIVGNCFDSSNVNNTKGVYFGTTVGKPSIVLGNTFVELQNGGVGVYLDSPSVNISVDINRYINVAIPVVNNGTNNTIGVITS